MKLKDLFSKKKTSNLNNLGIYAKLLDKEKFVKELARVGTKSDVIEQEWQKVEKIFSLYYLQVAHENLSKEKQEEVGEEIEQGKKGTEKFANKMTEMLKQNPDLVDQKTVIEEAAKMTYTAYSKSVSNNQQ